MHDIEQGQIWRNAKNTISLYIEEFDEDEILAVDEVDQDNFDAPAHSFSIEEFETFVKTKHLRIVK